MPNYQEMYYTMMRTSEKALRQIEAIQKMLIEAQQKCEDIFCTEEESVLRILPNEKQE